MLTVVVVPAAAVVVVVAAGLAGVGLMILVGTQVSPVVAFLPFFVGPYEFYLGPPQAQETDMGETLDILGTFP